MIRIPIITTHTIIMLPTTTTIIIADRTGHGGMIRGIRRMIPGMHGTRRITIRGGDTARIHVYVRRCIRTGIMDIISTIMITDIITTARMIMMAIATTAREAALEVKIAQVMFRQLPAARRVPEILALHRIRQHLQLEAERPSV